MFEGTILLWRGGNVCSKVQSQNHNFRNGLYIQFPKKENQYFEKENYVFQNKSRKKNGNAICFLWTKEQNTL